MSQKYTENEMASLNQVFICSKWCLSLQINMKLSVVILNELNKLSVELITQNIIGDNVQTKQKWILKNKLSIEDEWPFEAELGMVTVISNNRND